jgi:hypothetical protein
VWCLYSWGFGAGMQAVGGCAEGLVDLVVFTTGIPMLVESVQDGYQAVTDWDGYAAKKQAERDTMWGIVTGGPEAWGHAFVDPIVDEWENNPGHLVGGATFTAATFIVPGAGEIRALRGVKGAAEALKAEDALSVVSKTEGLSINAGQQAKHIPGSKGYIPGRSQLTADPELLLKSAGSGTPVGSVQRGQAGFKERVDFGHQIGVYISQDGSAAPTSVGIMHYRADGSVHVVPGRP